MSGKLNNPRKAFAVKARSCCQNSKHEIAPQLAQALSFAQSMDVIAQGAVGIMSTCMTFVVMTGCPFGSRAE